MGKHTDAIKLNAEKYMNDAIEHMYSNEVIKKAVTDQNRQEIKNIIVGLLNDLPNLKQYILEANGICEDKAEEAIRASLKEAFDVRAYNTDIFPEFEGEYFTELLEELRLEKIDKNEYVNEAINIFLDILDEPAFNLERNTVFAFAFALNMNAVDTEEILLEKALLQQGFNGKDYREAIYWWCLEHDFAEISETVDKCTKASKARELFEKYDNDEELKKIAEKSDKEFDISDNSNTVILTNEVMKYIKNEVDFCKYLYCLKNVEFKRKTSMNLSATYGKLLEKMPFWCEYNTDKLEYYLWKLYANTNRSVLKRLIANMANEYVTIIESLDSAKYKSTSIPRLFEMKRDLNDSQIEMIRQILSQDEKNLRSRIERNVDNNKEIKQYTNVMLTDYLYEILSGKTREEIKHIADRAIDKKSVFMEKRELMNSEKYYKRIKNSRTEFNIRLGGKNLKSSQIKAIGDILVDTVYKGEDGSGISRQDIIRSVETKRAEMKKEVTEFGLYEGELLNKEVLSALFKGIAISDKTLRKRLNFSGEGHDNKKKDKGVFRVSRKELLFAKFLEEANSIAEDCGESRTRKKNIKVFRAKVNKFLMDNYMELLYLRNPFELFIILCMTYDEPLDYFMASFSSVKMEELKTRRKKKRRIKKKKRKKKIDS